MSVCSMGDLGIECGGLKDGGMVTQVTVNSTNRAHTTSYFL